MIHRRRGRIRRRPEVPTARVEIRVLPSGVVLESPVHVPATRLAHLGRVRPRTTLEALEPTVKVIISGVSTARPDDADVFPARDSRKRDPARRRHLGRRRPEIQSTRGVVRQARRRAPPVRDDVVLLSGEPSLERPVDVRVARDRRPRGFADFVRVRERARRPRRAPDVAAQRARRQRRRGGIRTRRGLHDPRADERGASTNDDDDDDDDDDDATCRQEKVTVSTLWVNSDRNTL